MKICILGHVFKCKLYKYCIPKCDSSKLLIDFFNCIKDVSL